MRIGPDTHLLREVGEVQSAGLWACINSMVITGAEPVIVATGADRSERLEDVFGVVEPTDVRWVSLSLDDLDHAGALAEVMKACPHAVVVAGRAGLLRHADTSTLPLVRCRWVDDGESFEAGDRRLLSVQAGRRSGNTESARSAHRYLLGRRHLRLPPAGPTAQHRHRARPGDVGQAHGAVRPPRARTMARPRRPPTIRLPLRWNWHGASA